MTQRLLGMFRGGPSIQHSSNPITHHEAKLAEKKFDTDEMHVLKMTYQDLAERTNGKGIDKDTFLQYFPLNGLLGERMFAQFDRSERGWIDFDEFIVGLATVCRGSLDDKIHFLFAMYDLSHQNTVSKAELGTLLNHIPKEYFQRHEYEHALNQSMDYGGLPIQRIRSTGSVATASIDGNESDGHLMDMHSEYGGSQYESTVPREDTTDELDFYTNHDLVEKAFEECDLNHEGRLSYEEFKMWVQRTPMIMDYIESILPYNGPKDMQRHHNKKETLPHMRRITSRASLGRAQSIRELAGDIFDHTTGQSAKRLSLGNNVIGSSHGHLNYLGGVQSGATTPVGGASAHGAGFFGAEDASGPSVQRPGGIAAMSNSERPGLGNRARSATAGASLMSLNGNTGTGAGAGSVNGSAHGPAHNEPGSPMSMAGGSLALSRNTSFQSNPAGPNNPNGSTPGPDANGGTMLQGSQRLMLTPGMRFPSGDVSTAPYQNINYSESEQQVQLLLQQALGLTSNDTVKHYLVQLLDQEYGIAVGWPNTGTTTPLTGGGNLDGGFSVAGGANQYSNRRNSTGAEIERAHSGDIYQTVVAMEDYLWKKGKALHLLYKRYYLLSGNCMYYYSHQNDVRPKGVVFLTGSIIERLKDDDMELKGYYGFEIMHQDLCTGEHHRHEKRVLYCRSEERREKWVSAMQHAAHVVPIEDDYVIGKELGRGRFSVVCECVHKVTNEHCAVKIIDKATIEPEEKGLLRTEIAVLKLVNHPNIIRMEGLYESKNHIYIVMEMLKGGELFERIVGRPRFTEMEAARLIRPLLESVAYLHDLGIVHRDLKPENILCGEQLEDLKIADFGLSKMVLPKEKMDSACGTLSYVAPEVLTMQGYGREADLWSVGVIMFLLLCGKLPFDGDDHNEIIRSTIQADLKVNPNVWAKLSEEARGLMTSLLNKNPRDRITARDALKHPFLASLQQQHHQQHKQAVAQALEQARQHGLHGHPPHPPLHHPHAHYPTKKSPHQTQTPPPDHLTQGSSPMKLGSGSSAASVATDAGSRVSSAPPPSALAAQLHEQLQAEADAQRASSNSNNNQFSSSNRSEVSTPVPNHNGVALNKADLSAETVTSPSATNTNTHSQASMIDV